MPRRLSGLLHEVRQMARLGMQRVYLYEAESDGPIDAVEPSCSARCARLTGSEVSRLRALCSGFTDDVIAERLVRGDACYVCEDESNRILHASWVQSSGCHIIEDLGLQVIVDSTVVWIYDCRTLEAARGQRLYPLTLTTIRNEYGAKGCQRALIYTTPQNTSSQRGIAAAGFTRIATLSGFVAGPVVFPCSIPSGARLSTAEAVGSVK
jgi:hypothetical protein